MEDCNTGTLGNCLFMKWTCQKNTMKYFKPFKSESRPYKEENRSSELEQENKTPYLQSVK